MSVFLNILSLTLSLLAFALSLVSYLKVVRIEKKLITLPQTPKEENKEDKTTDEEQQKKVNELLSL